MSSTENTNKLAALSGVTPAGKALKQLDEMAKLMGHQRELQDLRTQMQEEFSKRERSLHKEIADREKALKEREVFFSERLAAFEARTVDLERERAHLQSEMQKRTAEHLDAITELKRQKEQFQAEFQERIEEKAGDFVNGALASLASSEKMFGRIGLAWSAGGLVAICSGLGLGYLLAVEGTQVVVANKDLGWALMLFFAAKGAVLLGLVYALARFCSRLGRSYLHESLKNAERRHAINYGKFYLSVYGAGSDWDKVKEAFAQWNINATSAFSEQNQTLSDRAFTQNVGEVVRAIVPAIQKATEGEKK